MAFELEFAAAATDEVGNLHEPRAAEGVHFLGRRHVQNDELPIAFRGFADRGEQIAASIVIELFRAFDTGFAHVNDSTSFSKSSSLRTGTPRLCAFSNLEPAFSPATT